MWLTRGLHRGRHIDGHHSRADAVRQDLADRTQRDDHRAMRQSPITDRPDHALDVAPGDVLDSCPAELSVDRLLLAIGLTESERRLLHASITVSQRDGEEYRRSKSILRDLFRETDTVDSPDPLRQLLAERSAAVAQAREDFIDPPAASRVAIAVSLAHMHVNRLVGIDPAMEHLSMALVRRTRDGLTHFERYL